MFDILGGRKARSDLFPPEKGSIYESDESRATGNGKETAQR
jgi:hypothetical protein